MKSCEPASLAAPKLPIAGVAAWSTEASVQTHFRRFAIPDVTFSNVHHFTGTGWQHDFRLFLDAIGDAASENVYGIVCHEEDDLHPWMSAPIQQIRERIEGEWFPQLLDDRGIVSHYQAIYDFKQSAVIGFEALARGRSGEEIFDGGRMMRAARAYGKTREFDAAARIAAIKGAGELFDGDDQLFVNLIPGGVTNPSRDFAFTWEAIRAAGIDPSRVVFEFVESESLPPIKDLKRIVEHLRSHGAKIALDDFGAGHSSVRIMEALRPDIVKFDRHLACSGLSISKQKLIREMVNYVHSLGCKTVAEGVETVEQMAFVHACGFQMVQGYLIGFPCPQASRPVVPLHIG